MRYSRTPYIGIPNIGIYPYADWFCRKQPVSAVVVLVFPEIRPSVCEQELGYQITNLFAKLFSGDDTYPDYCPSLCRSIHTIDDNVHDVLSIYHMFSTKCIKTVTISDIRTCMVIYCLHNLCIVMILMLYRWVFPGHFKFKIQMRSCIQVCTNEAFLRF